MRDSGLIDAYRQQLAQAADQTRAIIGRTVNRVGDRVLSRFQQAGSPVTYPIRWQSEKQRRAFFASNGFGHGIPYKRTNTMINAWRLVVIYDANRIPQIALVNLRTYRVFVVGRWQQNMFKGRWYQESVLRRVAQVELADEIESDLIRNLMAIDESALSSGGM